MTSVLVHLLTVSALHPDGVVLIDEHLLDPTPGARRTAHDCPVDKRRDHCQGTGTLQRARRRPLHDWTRAVSGMAGIVIGRIES